MPSTFKSELIATIIRTVLLQQVPGAEVLPPDSWPAYGISPTGLERLPAIVAYSSTGETLFIIELVDRTGAPKAKRHSALLRWSSAFRGPRAFVWAYASRTAYEKDMGELLSDTYVWFADEPKHHVFISSSPDASADFLSARFLAKSRASVGT